MKQKLLILTLIATAISTGFGFAVPAEAAVSTTRSITFPVLGGAPYSDDFGAPRSGGRTHEGIDIMGRKMQTLVAAVDGRITFLTATPASWGYSLTITDSEGYEYHYLHINNDTPGTDDGNGGYNNAYAPGIRQGSRVIKGQAIAFLGDSGNAESTGAHLHFEIRVGDTNEPINPYQSLRNATVIHTAVENPNMDVDDDDDTPSRPRPTTVSSTPVKEIFPYDQFEGGATVAAGNLDSDTRVELVTGTAFNGGGRTIINIYDLNGVLIRKFFAYGEVFRGGVDVAVADVDGDGKNEIVTAAGPTGGPHIKVFKADGTLKSEFMAYGAGFLGGVYVSAADIDADGKAEIVTGPGASGGPHVRVFDMSGKVKQELMAYETSFTGGVDVAAFAKEGSTAGGFVTSKASNGNSQVKVFDASAKLTKEFMAYEDSFTGGVRISAGSLIRSNGVPEIATMPASGSSPSLKVFKTTGGSPLKSMIAGFSRSTIGGFDVTVAGSDIYVSTLGGRRTSVRRVDI